MEIHRLYPAAAMALLLAVMPPQAADARSMNILPLGDSITQSSEGFYSYRYYLSQMLVDRGTAFNFVGSLDDQRNGNPAWPTYKGKAFDRDHEGHSGWRTGDILNGRPGESGAGKLTDWLQGEKVDVALIHLGTNDVLKGVDADGNPDTATTIDNLRQIVEQVRDNNSKATILISQIIPMAKSLDSFVRQLNRAIPSLVAELDSAQSPVLVVDQYSGFSKDWLYDKIHPDARGEQWIAQNFLGAIPETIANPTPGAAAMGLALLGVLTARRQRVR